MRIRKASWENSPKGRFLFTSIGRALGKHSPTNWKASQSKCVLRLLNIC